LDFRGISKVAVPENGVVDKSKRNAFPHGGGKMENLFAGSTDDFSILIFRPVPFVLRFYLSRPWFLK